MIKNSFLPIVCLTVLTAVSASAGHPISKTKPVPSEAVRVIGATGNNLSDDLQNIVNGQTDSRNTSIFTNADGDIGHITFGFDQPRQIQGLRYLARATKDIGQENDITNFSLHALFEGSFSHRFFYRGNFLGSSPYVEFSPILLDSIRVDFEQLKWNPNNSPVNIAEFTFFEPAWNVTVNGISSPELADGQIETKALINFPAEIKIILSDPTQLSGISWRESLAGTGAQFALFIDGERIQADPDPALRALHFETREATEVVLHLSIPEQEFVHLSEIDLYGALDLSNAEVAVVSFPNEEGREINPLVFGGNIQFWLDHDGILNDPDFAEVVRSTPLTLLRFPGGTESDRYLWREHRLYDPSQWPFVDGPHTTDTSEFVRFARLVGAETMICVNIEFAYHEGDVQMGAQYAADWVRYAKENNYNIKYWTIGNEMYWRLAYTAEEYAELVIAYARAMREVDPNIIIAVPGEIELNSVGKKDKPTAEGLAKMLETERKRRNFEITPRENTEIQNRLMHQYRNPDAPLWWPTLLDRVGDYIDMIEVHVYAGTIENAFIRDGGYAQQLRDLRAFAEERTGKPLLLAVTEWNTSIWWGNGKDAIGMEQALYIGEMLGRLIEGGTDLGTFWPITMRGSWVAKSLYQEKHHHVLPSFHMFSGMARNLRGKRLPVAVTHPAVYSIGSIDSETNTASLILMTRPTRIQGPVEIRIPLNDGPLSGMEVLSATTLSAPYKRSFDIRESHSLVQKNDLFISINLPQHGFTVLTFGNPR